MHPATRIILITGANGGLGLAIARAFLLESPTNYVALGVRERRERAQTLVQEFPDRCACLTLEVTEAQSWNSAVETLVAQHGRLDVLVNNAGRNDDALLATMPDATWDNVLATNLDSVFLGCRAVLPAMISQRSGRIVNISSLSALLAPPGQTNYAAAKAGVVALTESLAKEVARIGITVNAVCPGYIDTGGVGSLDEATRRSALAQVPMRRFGQPEEVAAAVRFLACTEASYITGSVLKIDGGIL